MKPKMNEQLQQSLITAASKCFQQLSECPELKNYKIYRDPNSLRQPVASIGDYFQAATTARQCSRQWILVVSTKRTTQQRQLVVSVQGWRFGATLSKQP